MGLPGQPPVFRRKNRGLSLVFNGGLSLVFLLAGMLRAQENRAPTTEDVLSIFSRRCVECHGIAKQSGKLRLDGLEAIFRGGKSGPAIVAGKSAESLLYRKVSPDAEKRMPPKGDPLSDGEIGTIRSWIDSGARAAAAAPPAG